MPYSLLIFRCLYDPLERLDDHLRAYRVDSVSDLASAQAVLRQATPDALIAPITTETLQLFNSIEANTELPNRPLLVLIAETPKRGLPADLVLPVRWIDQALLAALKWRSDKTQLQQKLDQEIGYGVEYAEAHKRAAREVDLLKNAIVRAVSHELKTPLLHVKSAVAMLTEDHNQDRGKLIGYATEATSRLEGVVKNVTQLADILEIKLEPIRAADAVAQAVRNLRRTWERKDDVDRIGIDISPRLPLIWADEQAIGIALQHLIDNGLKFSEKPVEVTARVIDAGVVFAVCDHGIGILPEKQDKIFEPFYQIDNSDARRFGGTGVGLAIVSLILDRHHTTIRLESEVGKGSMFSFALPCVE